MAKLESMLITPAKNKGLSVSHRYAPKAEVSRGRTGGGIAMITPRTEEYTFGPGEHPEAMAHIAKHLGMSTAREEQAEVGGRIARTPGMRGARQDEEETGGEE